MLTLTDMIVFQFREIKREMLNALSGLDRRDLANTGPGQQLPTGWAALHCTCVIDYMIVYHITGQKLLAYPAGIDKYPIDLPPDDFEWPAVVDLQDDWSRLMDHAIHLIEAAGETQMQSQSATGIEPLVESCLRVINHTNSHLRAIWCLIAQMGRGDKWPSQPGWMPNRALDDVRSELAVGLPVVGNHQSPFVRRLAKRYAPRVLHHDNRALLECCEDLLESRDTWQQMIACEWLWAARNRFNREDFYTFERWLNQYIFSWGTCDDFCKRVLNPYFERDRSVMSRIREWTESPNRWVRRASAVVFIHSERGFYVVTPPIDDVLDTAGRLMRDHDQHVQKALGWLLKAASLCEEERVLAFLHQHRAEMPRLSFRYALEHMPEDKRRRAMAAARDG